MVAPRYRSRTMRRVRRVTPGGRQVVHFKRRNPARAQCAGCKALLQAVPAKNPLALKAVPKSSRRPERPYGGVLCSACMRATIKAKARAQ